MEAAHSYMWSGYCEALMINLKKNYVLRVVLLKNSWKCCFANSNVDPAIKDNSDWKNSFNSSVNKNNLNYV